MNNKKAKRLRKDVMLKLYVGDDITAADVRKGKHDVMKEIEFKRVFRARKRNEQRKNPVVNHMVVDFNEYDIKAKQMHDVRIKKEARRRSMIKAR